jgi:hypothetical protein
VRKSGFLFMQHQLRSSPGVDVRAIMREVRARARFDTPERTLERQARRAVPSHLVSGIARMRAANSGFRTAIERIGDPPPAPPTLRGRFGTFLVRVAQRGIFWLIPSIRSAHLKAAEALDAQVEVTEALIEVLRQTNLELIKLRQRSEEAAPSGDKGP